MSELYSNRIALIPINNYSGCMNIMYALTSYIRILPHSSFSFSFFNLGILRLRQRALGYHSQSAVAGDCLNRSDD